MAWFGMESGLDITEIFAELKNFDSAEFEKSLTEDEVVKFRPYMNSFHVVKLQNKRFRELLEENNIEVPELVPVCIRED